MADGGGGGFGELRRAADRDNFLDLAVGADQGFENDGAVDVGAAGGVGIVGFDAIVEETLSEVGLEADVAPFDEAGIGTVGGG